MNAIEINRGHGSPYDRGSADCYYQRRFDPHWYPSGTYRGYRVTKDAMSQQEIDEYRAGFDAAYEAGDFKDWG